MMLVTATLSNRILPPPPTVLLYFLTHLCFKKENLLPQKLLEGNDCFEEEMFSGALIWLLAQRKSTVRKQLMPTLLPRSSRPVAAGSHSLKPYSLTKAVDLLSHFSKVPLEKS